MILSSAALMLTAFGAVAHTHAPNDFGLKAYGVSAGKQGSFLRPVAPNLYPLSAEFGLLPTNYDGTDEWPCYGGGAACSSIDPNGLVLGIPEYTWSLSACDNNNLPATPCGQINVIYQDATGDTTDDLIFTLAVKQGSNFILARTRDFGPNPFSGGTAIIYGDKAFGTQGASGKGNGWCAGSTHTCVNPVAGLAIGEATVQVGSYELKQKFSIWLQ
jgi:hypothetical protein